jgi:8-oxo-dGTP diphosphatase
MSNQTFLRRTATFLRRYPWIMACGYRFIHLWQPKYTLGVVGVMFNAEGQVLLVEHVFHPRKPWGLPGGWIERNEPPAEAVCREIQEELKLNTEIGSLLLIEITEGSHLDIAYLCHPTGNIGTLSNELLDYRWVAPSDLPLLTGFHYRAIQSALKINRTN